MKNLKFLLILFASISLLILSSYTIHQETPWVKEVDKKGIVVYTRNIPASSIKEFKAQTTIKAPLSKIVTLLKDIKSYPQWIYATEGSYLIQRKSDTEFIYYSKIKLPKPVEDRDLIAHMKVVELTDKKCLIKSSSLPKFIAEKPSIVRVKEFKGSWELTSISNNETLVVMQSHTDPAGTIPPWLINSMLMAGPFETLEKMSKILLTR